MNHTMITKRGNQSVDVMLEVIRIYPGIWSSELRRRMPELDNDTYNAQYRALKESGKVKIRRQGNKTRHWAKEEDE